MKKLTQFFILVILLSSCRKSESEFIWEKSLGSGIAMFLATTADSGFISCGEKEGSPYFVRFSKTKKVIIDFKDENAGSFSSAWFDSKSYIAIGCSENKLLLTRYSTEGLRLWEKLIDPGFEVSTAKLFWTGGGNLLAIASVSAESIMSEASGLLFVAFDTTGRSFSESSITDPSFLSANDACMDNNGNIFLALTRKEQAGKSKASVARFNSNLQKIWETNLFNNPEFGKSGTAISIDRMGDIYVAGKTEISSDDGVYYNSFLTSLTGTGTIRWSKYLEKSNAGSAVTLSNNNELLMLNRNCFIINLLDTSTGADAGRIRTFELCDSYNTDALSTGIAINYDSNYLLSGTRGGSYYLALKPGQ